MGKSQSSEAFRSESRSRHAILKPVKTTPPAVDPACILRGTDSTATPRVLAWIGVAAAAAPTVALDVETRGTRPEDPETAIVGLGMACSIPSGAGGKPSLSYIYLAWQTFSVRDRHRILDTIYFHLAGKLIAHNQLFDGMMLRRETGEHAKFKACTFGLFHQLASEGWKGQSWSLKVAMVDLLGWSETNEVLRDDWLIQRGHITKGPKQRKAETRDAWLRRVAEAAAEAPPPGKSSKVRPDKSQMWRVPAEILGPYCVLDCVATLLLFDLVMVPAIRRFPNLQDFHTDVFLQTNEMLIEQQLDGIRVDVPGFEAYAAEVRVRVAEIEARFRSDPRVAPAIAAWEEASFLRVVGPEPEVKHRPFRLREPEKFRKDGNVSKSWETWVRKKAEHEANPPTRGDWRAWHRRREKALTHEGRHGRKKTKTQTARAGWGFNLASPEHLRDLFYGPSSPIVWRESGHDGMNGHPSIEIEIVTSDGAKLYVECDRTKKGLAPTGKRAMGQWGDLGKTLLSLREEVKEMGYVQEWLSRVVVAPPNTPYAGTTRVHPGWISPGTITRRLVGKGPNLQQAPKSKRFMQNILADDGEIWIECDVASLEPTVLCELTRDPNLMLIYGPDANPNHDVYLTNGAALPFFGEAIRAIGYDPENPTAEAKARGKKLPARTQVKPVVLGKNYRMGARKMQSELRLQVGVFLTDEQAQEIDRAWKERYKVSGRDFSKALETEWKTRGGWFYDGLGHPCCVDTDYLKDAISRNIQGTGHSIFMILSVITHRLLTERRLQHRWRVSDWHDQYIFAVLTRHADAALQTVRDAYRELNTVWLQGLIPIKGEPKTATNMAQAKEAED